MKTKHFTGKIGQCSQLTPEFSAPPLLMVDATSLSGAMQRLLSSFASLMKSMASWLKPALRSHTEMDQSGMATLPGFASVNAMAIASMAHGRLNMVHDLTPPNY
jgi:hypothetical protein